MVWSGSRPACLPLPFICLPVLFICLNCLPVKSWLVSHFLSFVSQFFSFVSQAASFHLSPTSFHCLPGWVLVVGFPAGLSPTSFHLSPTSFHLSPRLGGRVPGRLDLSPTSFRVPGRVVSHFLLFVSHFFSFVSHFFSFVSQAGCLWSGSRPACLPLAFICLPVLFICLLGFPAGLSPTSLNVSPTSFHLSLRLGACGPVPGWLVSHFLAFLPFPFICLPLLFICLPGWVLVARFPGGLSPTSLHLSPTFSPNSLLLGVLNSFLRRVRPLCHCWCPPISTGHVTFLFMCLPGLSLVVSAHFRWSRSISFHLSPRSVTAGDATFLFICLPGLSLAVSALFRWGCNISIHLFPRSVTANVRPFLLAMQHFCSFVSQAYHICHCWCPPLSPGHVAFPFICLPGLSLLVSAPFCWSCSISIRLSPSLHCLVM